MMPWKAAPPAKLPLKASISGGLRRQLRKLMVWNMVGQAREPSRADLEL